MSSFKKRIQLLLEGMQVPTDTVEMMIESDRDIYRLHIVAAFTTQQLVDCYVALDNMLNPDPRYRTYSIHLMKHK